VTVRYCSSEVHNLKSTAVEHLTNPESCIDEKIRCCLCLGEMKLSLSLLLGGCELIPFIWLKSIHLVVKRDRRREKRFQWFLLGSKTVSSSFDFVLLGECIPLDLLSFSWLGLFSLL
jgi:hypothetical protein